MGKLLAYAAIALLALAVIAAPFLLIYAFVVIAPIWLIVVVIAMLIA